MKREEDIASSSLIYSSASGRYSATYINTDYWLKGGFMKYVSNDMKPIGYYCSEHNNLIGSKQVAVKVETEYTKYLPILQMFNINLKGEAKFTDTRNVSRDLDPYDGHTSGLRLSPTVLKDSRIDITQNDLLAGPVRLILNFTDRGVTICARGEFRKHFVPLDNSNFKDRSTSGKVLIFTIYTLNTPELIGTIYRGSNYLETLSNTLSDGLSDEVSDMKTVYKYAAKACQELNSSDNDYFSTARSNTVKVVTLQTVSEEDLKNNKTLFLGNLEWLMSQSNPVEIAQNPTTNFAAYGSSDYRNVLMKNTFTCYIVDPDERISDRWVNIAGMPTKIPKVKTGKEMVGLHWLFVDANGDVSKKHQLTKEEMDSCDFIFRTEEEAISGANLKQQYKDQIDTLKHNLEHDKVRAQTELARVKHDSEVIIAQLKRDLEELKHHREIEGLDRKQNYEFQKTDLELGRDRIKNEYDRSSMDQKFYYDSRRYARDDRMETIKNIGLGLTLATTMFLVFKKASG